MCGAKKELGGPNRLHDAHGPMVHSVWLSGGCWDLNRATNRNKTIKMAAVKNIRKMSNSALNMVFGAG